MCLTAVKQCGWALYAVPEELKTAELCLEAVKQYGKAFKYVPEELKAIVKSSINDLFFLRN
jgi:hypothetical protein